jgi:hypothetical protein
MSIIIGIGAVGAAALMPNWLLCHVVRTATSMGNDAWQRRGQNWRNKTVRLVFIHEGTSCINQSWQSSLSYGHHGAPLLAFKHTTISKHTMEQVYIVKTRKKLSLIMFISYSKEQCIDKFPCLFVASLDHCTTDAEHPWQQQRFIYVVYVPPHTPCPWFGIHPHLIPPPNPPCTISPCNALCPPTQWRRWKGRWRWQWQ